MGGVILYDISMVLQFLGSVILIRHAFRIDRIGIIRGFMRNSFTVEKDGDIHFDPKAYADYYQNAVLGRVAFFLIAAGLACNMFGNNSSMGIDYRCLHLSMMLWCIWGLYKVILYGVNQYVRAEIGQHPGITKEDAIKAGVEANMCATSNLEIEKKIKEIYDHYY